MIQWYASGLFVGLVLIVPFLHAEILAEKTTDPAAPASITADQLIAGAIDLTRGRTSYTELSMIVHRPDWERTSTLVAWSRGRTDALIRFVAPARDAGNATLKLAEKMWTFTPKLNRTIRLPYSLMSQSWAGSDFSYSDLSRSDKLLTQYTHRIVETSEDDGHVIYVVESIPKENAPVVWGKEVIRMRDDYVLLEQTYYDQDMVPLKRMVSLDIGVLGGRSFATRMRMVDLEEADRWTELQYRTAEFDVPLDDEIFTLFSLRNPRAR